jgi:5-methylcytosine-specific restriction endonuclease McrA
VSLFKGHFQGNKGYQLEILPNYNQLDYIFSSEKINESNEYKKIGKNKSKRTIPLGMRYKVLKRDNFKCVACGRTVEDGIKLHIDHKIPYSLGGLTEFSNLQTLCNECNISKSNKFIDK